jgi:hypothetical protein
MTSQRALHVVATSLGEWQVRRDDDQRVLSAHDTATDAEREARRAGAAEILIHDRYDRVHRVRCEAQ